MTFFKHFHLQNKHAILGASDYHWLRYDDERLKKKVDSYGAAQRGTRLHEFARDAILLGRFLPDDEDNLNKFVNDAIKFRMTPEQPLYFSDNCFGTADAICFDEQESLLRIHDLKTGTSPASTDQLLIYAGIFCLEYRVDPMKLKARLRLYTPLGVDAFDPKGEDIQWVVDKIIDFDTKINQYLKGERYDHQW